MKLRLSLTQRFVLVIGVLIVALLAGSYLIQSVVVRDGLIGLFEQRLSRCSVVLDQYINVHMLTRATEMDAVLTSPRFLAAVGTQDSATIGGEVPVYAQMLGAELFLVADENGLITFANAPLEAPVRTRIAGYLINPGNPKSIHYLPIGDEYFEILVAEVETSDGHPLGRLAVGRPFSAALAEDLRRLTGFDVAITESGQVMGCTNPDETQWMSRHGCFAPGRLAAQGFQRADYHGKELVYLPIESTHFNATVTFVGSPDEVVAPIQAKITLWLIVLATAGGLLAMAAIYTITDRRIGRQVNLLVGAADRIREGDLEFSIQAYSHDELGYLAQEFEKMRFSLQTHRKELLAEHEARLNSERLAAIGRLATGIIHDFKNPMAIIRGNVDLIRLKEGDASPLERHYLNIQSQIDRMAKLAQDILDYSKGRTRLERQPVHLEPYFAEILEGQKSAFEQAGLTLGVAGPRTLIANLDPARFRRVIDNMLGNALEALGPGGQVMVRFGADGACLNVSVEDDGPGIPEEIRHTLFDPFVTSGKKQGTGLGLAISLKIVEDHGGQLSVESDPSWGTRFTITVPEAVSETAAVKEPTS